MPTFFQSAFFSQKTSQKSGRCGALRRLMSEGSMVSPNEGTTTSWQQWNLSAIYNIITLALACHSSVPQARNTYISTTAEEQNNLSFHT